MTTQPDPAQMGITSTVTPEVLQVLDSAGKWVPIGSIDPVAHTFSGPLRIENFGGVGYLQWWISTTYTIGQVVVNLGRLYICRTAGVSAAYPSNGPIGTGTGIVDGTVVWDYNGAPVDCLPALISALASVAMGAYPETAFNGPSSGKIVFGAKSYHFSATINLLNHCILEGMGSGQTGGAGTIFTFPPATTGLIVNNWNTINDTTRSGLTGAQGSVIRGIRFTLDDPSAYLSSNVTPWDGVSHGIRLRARATLEDVSVQYFGGNGIHIVASSGSGGATEGNVNSFMLNRVLIWSCGQHAVYVNGSDANAGLGIGISIYFAGCGGIHDRSFLGNTWVQPIINSYNSNLFGQCTYGGVTYQLIQDTPVNVGQTVTPGTGPAAGIWYPQPAASGQFASPWSNTGKFVPSMPFFIGTTPPGSGDSSARIFGGYVEGNINLPVSHLLVPAMAFGTPAAFTITSAVESNQSARGGWVSWQNGVGSILNSGLATGTGTFGDYVYGYWGYNYSNGDIARWRQAKDAAEWIWNFIGADWRIGYGTPNTVFTVTGVNTTNNFSRPAGIAPVPYVFNPVTLAVGAFSNARIWDARSALLNRSYARGEIVWNVAPAVGGAVGWIATLGGTLAVAWVGATSYAPNAIVANGANTYICMTGGVSAASGGPTGTGTNISDGTVVWNYYSALAVVLPFGNTVAESSVSYTVPAAGVVAAGAVTPIQTLFVTGAVTGNYADASFSLDTLGLILYAWVSANGTTKFFFYNPTSASITLASGGAGTVKVRVRT